MATASMERNKISPELLKRFEQLEAENKKLSKALKDSNDDAAGKRHNLKDFKKALAESLGLAEGDKTDADLIKEQIAEIAKKNKELEEKYLNAEKEKTQLQKLTEAKDLADKAGLNKDLAVKLIDIEGDLQAQVNELAEKYPELKVKKPNVGGGTPPAGGGNNAPELQQQYDKAMNDGDMGLAIRLKNRIFGITK
ncbi:MAG: hypothetical protein US20_C0005G0016 [Candidatus Pacebacteria bacterium GW2011_GWF1_36_5]|nr:MAG: hypothetical protein US20_C0005G0016 [Candidatus Pacebacteria bacterium GW2011_GWF1_36_5]